MTCRRPLLTTILCLAAVACTERPRNETNPSLIHDGAAPSPSDSAPPARRDGLFTIDQRILIADAGPPNADASSTHADSTPSPHDLGVAPADTAPPRPDKGEPPADSAPPTPDVSIPARELLLFDEAHHQFTAADKGFHDLLEPGDAIPAANWLQPVDYYNGQMQIRYVVEGPANQAPGKLQTCIWTMGDGDGDGRNWFPEACSAQVLHQGPGTYFNNRLVPADWWKNEGVPLDFTHPEWFRVRVVLRGETGCNVTTYNVNKACWDQWPLYEQMKFRVTIVMVPAGATFSGWQNYP